MISQQTFRRTLFFSLLVTSVLLCLAMMRPFLISLCWAAVLAVGVTPLYRRLITRLSPTGAAGLCCGVVLLVVLVPLLLAVTEITRESAVLSRDVTQFAADGTTHAHLANAPRLHAAYHGILAAWARVPDDWRPGFRSVLQQVGAFAASRSVGVLTNLVWVSVQAGVTLLTLFFLLRDASQLRAAVRPFLPFEEPQAVALGKRVNDLIYISLFGMVLVAVTQGVLDGLAFWIIGLPLPLLWGTALAVASMIPFVGAPVVWIPACLYLAAQGQYGKAVILAALALLLHGTTDHLLRPLFIGAYTRTHVLLTFFGVLAGMMLLGPIGLFLGPVIVIVPLALIDMLRAELFVGGEGARPC